MFGCSEMTLRQCFLSPGAGCTFGFIVSTVHGRSPPVFALAVFTAVFAVIVVAFAFGVYEWQSALHYLKVVLACSWLVFSFIVCVAHAAFRIRRGARVPHLHALVHVAHISGAIILGIALFAPARWNVSLVPPMAIMVASSCANVLLSFDWTPSDSDTLIAARFGVSAMLILEYSVCLHLARQGELTLTSGFQRWLEAGAFCGDGIMALVLLCVGYAHCSALSSCSVMKEPSVWERTLMTERGWQQLRDLRDACCVALKTLEPKKDED